ncbi:MAG: hypothetical protein LBS19_13290 [Clostridiales bacterium]|nr:hypothetical protein [Clostridiales bacterium]
MFVVVPKLADSASLGCMESTPYGAGETGGKPAQNITCINAAPYGGLTSYRANPG